jgi:hypothetical protein
VSRILQCAFLAPDIVERTLDGRQPHNMTLEHVRTPLPIEWAAERQSLGSCSNELRHPRHPMDVDREFVTMMFSINENESWYLDENITKHATEPNGVNRQESMPIPRQEKAFSLIVMWCI